MIMKKFFKSRFFVFSLICVCLFTTLGIRLAYLTLKKGETYYVLSQERKSVKLTLRGRRGNILDRNGIPLAINRQIYVVEIDGQQIPNDPKQLNNMLINLINIVEGNEDKLVDNLPIKYDKPQGFYYDLGNSDPDIQKNRYKRWARDANIKGDNLPADEVMKKLKERFKIDDNIPDELARKVVSIRMDLYMNRYKEYRPIRVAENINAKTVAQVETYLADLPGVQTRVESGRYYPMGDTASHIIGYVGRISQEKAENCEKEGYDVSSDKIGINGIEGAFEKWLTGSTNEKHGLLWAEVNSSGRIAKVLKEEPPEDGNDIYLTLDSRLQKCAEDILAEEITKMQNGMAPYDGERNRAPLAKNGAAVIIDVHTGEILSMASYPSFDLNLFVDGISSKNYNKLVDDPAKPLYGLAFQGGIAPGSVFKMLVGIAGLMEGKVGLHEQIYDRVYYDVYDKYHPPACSKKSGHGNEDLVDALKHSCNYYFYTVADRLGIDAINHWAKEFGLIGHTGLEILDKDADYNIVASPDVKEKAERYNIKSQIYAEMKAYGYFKDLNSNEQKEAKDELLNALADVPLSNSHVEDTKLIRKIFEDKGYFEFKDENNDGKDDIFGITKKKMNQNKINASYRVRQILVDRKRWKGNDTVITGIGQSYTQISPLGIARYVAAIANNGNVLETHVVKDVVSPEGKIIKKTEPIVLNKLDVPQSYFDAVKLGMHKVVYDFGGAGGGGTASKYFKDMDSNITLGGKTGTAQVIAGKEERNNAWFVAFSPYEDPEIAVAVAIPNGRTAGNAAPVARRILEEYYRIKNQQKTDTIQETNKPLQ